jgi:hypothetical protein
MDSPYFHPFDLPGGCPDNRCKKQKVKPEPGILIIGIPAFILNNLPASGTEVLFQISE